MYPEAGKAGVYKGLASFERFLRNNSSNSRDRLVFVFVLAMEEALFSITITLANCTNRNLFDVNLGCLVIQI